MKHLSIFATLLLSALYFTSCSVSKKIDKAATRSMLSTPAFSPAHTGIAIYDVASGQYLYSHQADKYFVPASNTKIITCYAALKFLKDSVPALNYSIINDSAIIVEPLGDPTFLHAGYNSQRAYQLLKQFKYIHILEPAFKDYLGSGWSWDDYLYYYMAQRSEMPIYGNIATATLKNGKIEVSPTYFYNHSQIAENIQSGFTVNKAWDTNDFIFNAGDRKRAEIPFVPNTQTLKDLLEDTLHAHIDFVESVPQNSRTLYSMHLDSVLKPMMHRSDNFFAEQMLLATGRKITGSFNEQKILDTLSALLFRELPQKPKWVDGSGLSVYNLFSPQDFVILLNEMRNEFGMERLQNILPTGGTGTLSSYYKDEGDYIFAKTGTISGVVTLSGFLYTKKNKLLVFSILVNNHNTPASEIRKGIEQFLKGVRKS